MTLQAEDREALARRFAKGATEQESLYGRIRQRVAHEPAVLDLYDVVPGHRRLPVLLLAAVHYLVLDGVDGHLKAIYSDSSSQEAVDSVGDAFVSFCENNSHELRNLMRDRCVQTNEANRCVGLLPALMEAHRSSGKTLALLDLGASAGLNLLFDRYRYQYTNSPVIGSPGATVRLHCEVRGRAPRLDPVAPSTDFRAGIDLDPIDVNDPDERRWLQACIWVGEVAREQRLDAALELAQREWRDVRRGDVIEELPELLDEVPSGAELCIFSSWTMWWMREEDRTRLFDVIQDIGNTRPVWWITMEGAGVVPGIGDGVEVPSDAGVLGLQYFSPGERDAKTLALIHHHGAWMTWLDPETSA